MLLSLLSQAVVNAATPPPAPERPDVVQDGLHYSPDGVLRSKQDVDRMDDTVDDNMFFTLVYWPFDKHNHLVKIPNPTLTIGSQYPRLDGATALFPVYAAAVQAIYKNTR